MGFTFSLVHVKQTDADQVDLWLTNSLFLPVTVTNVSLSHNLQGLMKVGIVASDNDGKQIRFK